VPQLKPSIAAHLNITLTRRYALVPGGQFASPTILSGGPAPPGYPGLTFKPDTNKSYQRALSRAVPQCEVGAAG
jgi:hypothetical protein